MGKSPGKWIKTVLFGKKSKHHISKGREKFANEREVVVAAKASGANYASIPPAASHPFPSCVERNEGKLEVESKQAGDIHHADEIVLEGNQSAGTQGSKPQDAPIDSEQIKKEQAAATILQATFRGYLARRAFWALKGIIRLQALIRGHLVRRQAVATLCSMLGIVKFQALIRGKRVRASDIGIEVQSKCSLVFQEDGKHVDPVNISTQMAKLSTNAFIHKLLAPSPNVTPLYVHYEPSEPNSVVSWLERWSSTHFWKPVPQPKKIIDVKSQKKLANGQIAEPHASRSKRTRRPHSTNTETVSVQATSEFEKPKRTFRKVSSHPVEPGQENPQIELEKVKRNLRKVHNPVVENSAPSEAETEPKQNLEKELTSLGHDGTEQYVSNATEKAKKEPVSSEKAKKEPVSSEKAKKESTSNEKAKKEIPSEKVKKEPTASETVKRETPSSEKVKKVITSNEKVKKEPTTILSDVDTVPEPVATGEISDVLSGDQPMVDAMPPTESLSKDDTVLGDQVAVEMLELTDGDVKHENASATNGEMSQKEDLTATENNVKSGRKASTPAKQDRAENGLQSSPALPSYMAATESAKAKLRAQGSPRLAAEATEKNNLNRRHSLPSATNMVSSQSPRTQRPAQSGGKGGNKGDRSLSSRDGNGKVTQAEWRR